MKHVVGSVWLWVAAIAKRVGFGISVAMGTVLLAWVLVVDWQVLT